ncbi:hypothetical protein FHS51_004014 [Sphingobium wenxiniae]|nr:MULTISPECIES: acyl-CoA reductase [Sphingobium]MBB6193756.1 hypothetical protein [Sphingobium wenxiniae]WRD75363.1 acyl-CoA reductase [Sphingobium baderi]
MTTPCFCSNDWGGKMTVTGFRVPLILRGTVIEDNWIPFGGRRGGVSFESPDVALYGDQINLRTPSLMADLYKLRFTDIVEYLVNLGERLTLARNSYWEEAFQLARRTSGLSDSILHAQFDAMGRMFDASRLREAAERACGIAHLEGWVEMPNQSGNKGKARVRAFGARAVHVIAGNLPVVAAMTIIRNALTRSDCVIKTPSNDPLTAAAIARTMIDMAPDHPLTRHVSVAYWKGGDDRVEKVIYDPRGVEKIIAWGGLASISHISKYLQPGIDLVTLDPKLSGTIIGKDAFVDEDTMRHVARRLALDIGLYNQEACVNARVVYVHSGTDQAGLRRCERLAELTFEAIRDLPPSISTPHKDFDRTLREEIDAISYLDDEYRIVGNSGNDGAVIVSLNGEPVDFSATLGCRVANLVPVDDIDIPVRSVNAYTQTIGIYPEQLKEELRDRLAFQGAQRVVSLGAAGSVGLNTEIQDGIEPMRRMCKWIVDESCDGQMLEALAHAEEAETQ